MLLSELNAVPSPAGKLVKFAPLPENDVAVATPVITTPFGFACAFTFPPLSLREVASIPVGLIRHPQMM